MDHTYIPSSGEAPIPLICCHLDCNRAATIGPLCQPCAEFVEQNSGRCSACDNEAEDYL